MKEKLKRVPRTKIIRSRDPLKKALFRHGIHNCGGGYTGHIVKTKTLTFCGFCGREFEE